MENAYQLMLRSNKNVVFDKFKTELHTQDAYEIYACFIGHMVATPTQFYTNFFVREDYCIQYVIRGKGDYFTNNKLYKLSRGCLWLLPKDQYHYYTADKDEPYEYLWLHLNGNGVKHFLKKIGLSDENPVIEHLTAPEIETRFKTLIDICKLENANEHLVLSGVHALLYEIENACEKSEVPKKAAARDRSIDEIISFIKDNYRQNIDLSDIAEAVHLDKMYLIKKFKKKTGLTPIQFLIRYRVTQSCTLLHSDASLSLEAIAKLCGFNNLTNYLRRFKDFLGVTPTQYRKRK